MRVVKWSPQERVDLPDLAATSFLAIGEFRRTIREALIGGDENRVLRGFEVEASAVPDALITVKLNDAGTLSVAVGAENLGNVTHGQLIGGVDDAARNEGNAQQTLDFTGQPNPATYTVQMRFVYADGANDNRAFWADATDSEFVSSADTRYLPGFELRLSGAASAEWIDLASVVWGGSTITAGNITDLRSFAMEGVTPYEQTTQAGAGGMPDFSRLATRGDTAVGINALWGVVRALGRQIQDIKGEDDSGNWNWWGRVFKSSTLSPTDTTKTLRTLHTVTYTVGDGSTSYGDYSGVDGLDDCLDEVFNLGANAPANIRIVLKNHSNAPFSFTIPTARAFDAAIDTLRIEGNGNLISCTVAAVAVCINLQSSTGRLELSNVAQIGVTNNATFANVVDLQMENSVLLGNLTATANPVVVLEGGSRIRTSYVEGLIRVQTSVSPAIVDGTSGTLPVRILQSSITGAIDVPAVGLSTYKVTPLQMESCLIKSTDTHTLGATAVVYNNGHTGSSFRNCEFRWNPENDCLSLAGTTAVGAEVSGCVFYPDGTPTTGGGYAIVVGSSNVRIETTRFHLFDILAGGVKLVSGINASISRCDFQGDGATTGRAATLCAIYGVGSANDVIGLSVDQCSFESIEENTINSNTIVFDGTLSKSRFTSNVFTDCGEYVIDLQGVTGAADQVVISDNIVNITVTAGRAFHLGISINSTITGNSMKFPSTRTAITGGVTGDWVCSGNRIHNGTIAAGTAVLYGYSGGGGPTNLNYLT